MARAGAGAKAMSRARARAMPKAMAEGGVRSRPSGNVFCAFVL